VGEAAGAIASTSASSSCDVVTGVGPAVRAALADGDGRAVLLGLVSNGGYDLLKLAAKHGWKLLLGSVGVGTGTLVTWQLARGEVDLKVSFAIEFHHRSEIVELAPPPAPAPHDLTAEPPRDACWPPDKRE
jgi:hypothetical protein